MSVLTAPLYMRHYLLYPFIKHLLNTNVLSNMLGNTEKNQGERQEGRERGREGERQRERERWIAQGWIPFSREGRMQDTTEQIINSNDVTPTAKCLLGSQGFFLQIKLLSLNL